MLTTALLRVCRLPQVLLPPRTLLLPLLHQPRGILLPRHTSTLASNIRKVDPNAPQPGLPKLLQHLQTTYNLTEAETLRIRTRAKWLTQQDTRVYEEYTTLLETYGFARSEIWKMFLAHPHIFSESLELHLRRTVTHLEETFSPGVVRKIIRKFPAIIMADVPLFLARFQQSLALIDLSKDEILRIVETSPFVLGCTPRNLVPKLKYFQSLGMTTDQIRLVLAKQPSAIGLSLENLRRKVDLLRELFTDLKIPQNQVLTLIAMNPVILSFSYENRVVPRVEAILKAKDTVWNSKNIATSLTLSEKDFETSGTKKAIFTKKTLSPRTRKRTSENEEENLEELADDEVAEKR